MTNMRATVTAAVLERGDCTLDDLQAILPEVSRVHLGNALYLAVSGRHLRVVRRGESSKRIAAVWGPPLQRSEHRSFVTSVFDLGERPVWQGAWPPVTERSTVHHPLGGWDEA